MSEANKRKLYTDHLIDVVDLISLAPSWRRRLWDAPVGQRIAVDDPTLAKIRGDAGRIIRENRLRFAVFNDGATGESGCVFGFESAEFPDIVTYSSNWGRDWGSDSDKMQQPESQ
jgi:hypothetical protein